jgi:hypothetical protein
MDTLCPADADGRSADKCTEIAVGEDTPPNLRRREDDEQLGAC